MSNDNHAELQKLKQALEEARHALVIVNGAIATDRPDLFNFPDHPDAYWKIDNKAAIAVIDRALD